MTDPATQRQNLLNLPDDTFRNIVENNLGNDAPAGLWPQLLHPDVVRRTHSVLSARHRDVEDQLAVRAAEMKSFRQECFARGPDGKAAWFEADGEYQRWKRRAIGYRRLISARLAETKRALSSATPPPRPANPTKKTRQIDTVFQLAWAIHQHRQQCLNQGIVPDDHDVALWRALDRIRVDTSGGPITVAEFLADITSKPNFTPPDDHAEVA